MPPVAARIVELVEDELSLRCIANKPRFCCYSQLPTEVYWGLLMPTVISVSTLLPASSLLSVCYCPLMIEQYQSVEDIERQVAISVLLPCSQRSHPRQAF